MRGSADGGGRCVGRCGRVTRKQVVDRASRQGLRVRRNPVGFLTYAFAYSAILQPACLWGYFSELLGLRKTWGTK